MKAIFRLDFFLKVFFVLYCSSFALSEAAPKPVPHKEESPPLRPLIPESDRGYTANFTNISIVEVVKFLSRISGVNFIYNEGELAFSVTLVSEEPTSASNLMSAFIQVLRVNGFTIIEEGNNLIITKVAEGQRLGTIVSPDNPFEGPHPPPLVTRVFPINHANPSSIADIIRAMLSAEALVEVSVETRHLIVTDVISNIDRISILLKTLDAPSTSMQIDIYDAKFIEATELVVLATQIIKPISEGTPLFLVPQTDRNAIFIISTPFLIDKTLAVLEDLDGPTGKSTGKVLSSENIFLYKISNRDPQEIITSLKQIGEELEAMGFASKGLLETIVSVRYIDQTHSLLFIGDQTSIAKVKELLSEIDVPINKESQETFFIYKIKNAKEEQIEASLNQLLENLESSPKPDAPLISAIKSMKWIRETNSLVFTGEAGALQKLNDILVNFDIAPIHSEAKLSQIPASTDFYMYMPKHRSGEQILKAIEHLTTSLQDTELANPGLIHTLQSAKWLPSSGAVVFTGDQESLAKIKAFMPTIDIPPVGLVEEPTVYIYKVKHVSREVIEKGLENLAKSLPGDQGLQQTISSMTWIPQSHSFVFKGPTSAVQRIKEVLELLDSPMQAQEAQLSQKTYYLYKLQNVQGDVILHDIERVGKNIESSGIDDQGLIATLRSIEWIRTTNSLFISGTAQNIDQAKAIISEFDVPREKKEEPSNFFIYKPKYRDPLEMQEGLKNVASDLEQAGLSDPALIESIQTMRVAEQTKTLIFAGSPATLNKVKELLAAMDTPLEEKPVIHQIGKTTFLIYRIQYVPSTQLMSSLRSVAKDMEMSDSPDRDLIRAINQMRYVKETNSLVFIAKRETLDKIEQILQKFDISTLAPEKPLPAPRPGVTVFLIYKPKNQSGEELIQTIKEFEQNLIESGVQNPELFETIEHLKYMDKTASIVISGDQASVDKVKELLERFDVPTGEKPKPSIETIDDVSFLLYKLQFHKGSEIESALQKIAADFKKQAGEKSQKLIEAINSLQWIEVTNSLIATGEPSTLSKLKELLENIDTPLRQVFIEVLIVETSLANTLNFGLRWASQGKYRNKFGYATGSFPPLPASGVDPLGSFATNLQSINGTTTFPTGSQIPLVEGGWDLGIIGDLIFHKGQTFFALGSLINALQNDTDSSVILNQKIITQDNKTSTVFVGSNLPFTGSVVTNTGNNATVTNQNLEYRDVGLSLTITPTLGETDIVTLEINQDITEVIENPVSSTDTAVTVFGIATSKNSTATRVHVPDRNFFAISGQIRNQRTHSKTSLPCLGGLPFIGAAFSQNDTLTDKTNVIIFIRPHIVDSVREYKKVTETQESIYRSQAPDKEFFDAGIDMVKTPENE